MLESSYTKPVHVRNTNKLKTTTNWSTQQKIDKITGDSWQFPHYPLGKDD